MRRTQLASFTRFAYSALPTVIATSGVCRKFRLPKKGPLVAKKLRNPMRVNHAKEKSPFI